MSTDTTIERISAPSAEVFLREYVLAQRPVILTDLFRGQPITAIDTEAKARAQLGAMPVTVQAGYERYYTSIIGSLLQGEFTLDMPMRESTLAGYLDHVAQEPTSRDICAEVPGNLMQSLKPLFEPPAYCKGANGELDPLYSYELWMANRGNFTHLHYDGDQRQALQYQVFGEKRVILVPPAQSKKLAPISNTVALSPEGLSERELDDFVRSVGGMHAVLKPGDTLFLPALIWHGFQYLDTTMAITLRFHRNQANTWLAENTHRDFHFQALGWHLVNDQAADPRWRQLFDTVVEAHRTLPGTANERAEALQALVETEHAARCTSCLRGEYVRGFYDVLRKSVRTLEVVGSGLYERD